MKMSRAGFFVGLAVSAVYCVAQTSVVTSFDRNGRISWTATTTNVDYYRVEWASSPTGQWSYSWTGLDNIAPVNGSLATNVPLFYRVVAIRTPSQGDRCDNPFLIDSGTVTGDSSSVFFLNDYSATNCGFATTGPDLVYQFTLPAGQRLTASVSPTGGYDTTVYLVASPSANCESGPAACLAAVNAGSAGVAETAAYVNASASPLNVFM